MKRIFGHFTALACALAAFGSAGGAIAATDPAAPAPGETPPPPAPMTEAPAAAPSDAAPPPAPPAPPPAAAPAKTAAAATTTPGSIRLKTEEPTRDSYDGPPLLLGRGSKVKVGAYGALGGGYTRFMGRDSGVLSLEAALLLDHRFSLGVVGYGFSRTPRGPNAGDGTRQEFAAGYGGLALRYSWLGNLPIYPTFGVVLGGGAVNLHRDNGWDDDGWDVGWDDDDHDAWERGRFDPFLFVQPELALNANATRWLRLGATLGYRFTGGVGRFGLDSGDLNGVVAGGNIALGWF